jgi:hypothetical protein
MSKPVLPDHRPKRAAGGSQACEPMDALGRLLPAPHRKASTSLWCIILELGKSTTARTAINGCSLVKLNQGAFLSDTFPMCPLAEKPPTLKLVRSFASEAMGPQHIELLRLIGTLVRNDPGGQ